VCRLREGPWRSHMLLKAPMIQTVTFLAVIVEHFMMLLPCVFVWTWFHCLLLKFCYRDTASTVFSCLLAQNHKLNITEQNYDIVLCFPQLGVSWWTSKNFISFFCPSVYIYLRGCLQGYPKLLSQWQAWIES
jgi:hypothetical protein